MPTDPLSLKSLLLGGAEVPLCEGQEAGALAEVSQAIRTKVPHLSWANASKEIDEQVGSILNHPIDEMLVGVWAKYKDLQKYRDTKAYPPGRTILTSLAKHEVEASFNPSVVIQVAGMDTARLELPIMLRLHLEGVILKIEGGKILALQAGSLQGVATVEFRLSILRPKLPSRNLFQPIENETAKLDFPATISFGEGVAIRSAADSA